MAEKPESFRLFNCAACGKQVVVCSSCDRGRRYCADGCSGEWRRESVKRAAKTYQDSVPGRLNHARRQRRYRQRQKMLTHQCSVFQRALGILCLAAAFRLYRPATGEDSQASVVAVSRDATCCHFCGGVAPGFLRFCSSSSKEDPG